MKTEQKGYGLYANEEAKTCTKENNLSFKDSKFSWDEKTCGKIQMHKD